MRDSKEIGTICLSLIGGEHNYSLLEGIAEMKGIGSAWTGEHGRWLGTKDNIRKEQRRLRERASSMTGKARAHSSSFQGLNILLLSESPTFFNSGAPDIFNRVSLASCVFSYGLRVELHQHPPWFGHFNLDCSEGFRWSVLACLSASKSVRTRCPNKYFKSVSPSTRAHSRWLPAWLDVEENKR